MSFLRLIVASLVIIHTTDAVVPSFLPTLFVTKQPERMNADESRTYGVTICKPTQYDNYSATAQVNIPQGWKPSLGLMAQIDICTDFECQKIIASNFAQGKFLGNHFAKITYHSAYGDLFVRTTAGRSNYLDWTVAVDFKKMGEHNPVWEKRTPFKEAWYIEAPIAKSVKTGGEVETLSQIVKTASVQTVQTLDAKEFLFYFCPDKQTTMKYDVIIATTAVDSKSAMATYICTKAGETCTVNTALVYDPSGTGLNTVTVHTGSGTVSELRALIVGYGDGEQNNSFQLGAKLIPK